jgi:hypothetical protein
MSYWFRVGSAVVGTSRIWGPTAEQGDIVIFPLVDVADNPVMGKGASFSAQLAWGKDVPIAGDGATGEIGLGLYFYSFSPPELSSHYGPVMIIIPAFDNVVQQNVPYVISDPRLDAVEFTYTVINTKTNKPMPDIEIWITADVNGLKGLWHGQTDAFGVARDGFGNKPKLDPGVVYVWKHGILFIDNQNPDLEIVV